MKPMSWFRWVGVSCLAFGLLQPALAQDKAASAQPANMVETMQVNQIAGSTVIRIGFAQALAAAPASFSINNPPRIAFDLPNTGNALGRSQQTVNEGELGSINVVQVGDRTRLVLNLRRMSGFETRLEGKDLFINLAAVPKGPTATTEKADRFSESEASDRLHGIRDINFRRGPGGEARILVDLSDPGVGINIRQQGQSLVVDFARTSVAEAQRRRLDVTDFATPVTAISTAAQGENTRMTIAARGGWEHNAYQSDTQFVIEIKALVEDPNKLIQSSRPGYQGEKLSLNFQNVDVRAVLQVIADFTGFNIITSDTVSGGLTLRLKDVPWDQALDIILQAKGLDKRKTGNVIWIAPRDELAAREKLILEANVQISDLEPVRTETFQLNYHSAKAVFDGLTKNKEQSVLSRRGSIVMDERSNKLFVTDAPSRLEDFRRMIAEIDVAVRQVQIEARIVEASDTFAKNLGSRLGVFDRNPLGHQVLGDNKTRFAIGGGLSSTGYTTGQIATPIPNFFTDGISSNLRSSGLGNYPTGQFSLVLFNRAMDQFLNLELSALEADGRGRIVSSPRVVTADKIEALIEQGVEIPYQQATASGATSIAFRKANLALKVKPNITPDGRVNLTVDVTKDSPNTKIATGAGVAIDTKHVKTEVLVENGGTVVIGGIYLQEQRDTTTRIPFLGDLPYVGFLFKNVEKVDDKSELLIFITPKIISETLGLR